MHNNIVIALAFILTVSGCNAESIEFIGCRWSIPNDLDKRIDSDGAIQFTNDNINDAGFARTISFFSSLEPSTDVSTPPVPQSEARQLVKSDRIGDFYIWEYAVAVRDASERTLGHFSFAVLRNRQYGGDTVTFTEIAEYMKLINACSAQIP